MIDILDRLKDPLAANTYGEARRLLDEAAEEIEALRTLARQIKGEITDFDRECAAAEYTDTGAVWEMLYRWRRMLQLALKEKAIGEL